MEVIYLDGSSLKFDDEICCAIGFFDGLHLGHCQLINAVRDIALKKGYKKALMTFDHYPLFVLNKVKEERYLTTIEDRKHILEQHQFDYLFVIKFTKEVADLSPEDFIQRYIISSCIKHVVCGFDFRFGKANQGTIDLLKQTKQLDVSVIDEVLYRGEKISSSRIRHVLQEGNIDDMVSLLGRRYSIHGQVIHGQRIGRTIGFPTANIAYNAYQLPKNGVYAVKVYRQNEEYLGMCNIGYNPTLQILDSQSVEVFILDFHEEIYGEELYIEFYHLIREEKAFDSKASLIKQLNQDEQYVKQYFMKSTL